MDLEPSASRGDARRVHPTRSAIRGAALATSAVVVFVFANCATTRSRTPGPDSAVIAGSTGALASDAPLPTESRFCASCHPAIYAEHRQNTHGSAFHDTEARMATRGFRREDCVRCHTPRPVAETGIGMTPMTRWTNLDEGNTCLSCHAKTGVDYTRFRGGKECTTAFEPRVGDVAHCATCHRIAGTPEQWSRAEHGKLDGRVCVDCHMPRVERPVAIGEAPRPVRSHVFPASRSATQLARAYRYEASIEGNEVVVRITNDGVGHNFPTANRQRAVESLVIVRDLDGKEIGRSRLQCRYPYALELEPHQLTMPVSTQIPSGQTREQRVPIGVAAGTVESRLFFKTYRPSDDDDPQLSRCLAEQRIPFEGITPSERKAEDAPLIGFPAPPTTIADFIDPAGISNVVRPAPGSGPVKLPEGTSDADITKLTTMLESHLPEVRRLASNRLVELGASACPELIATLGRWSNESFNGAMKVLSRIGEAAIPSLVAAMSSDQLYVRIHARQVLADLDSASLRAEICAALLADTHAAHPLDRRSAAEALGLLGGADSLKDLRILIGDPDPDVVIAAAEAMARLDDHDAVPGIESALAGARYPESKLRLGVVLARLGSAAGIPALLDGLDAADPLVREQFFAGFFAATGVHLGYDPDAPLEERLVALARLQSHVMQHPGKSVLRLMPIEDPHASSRAWQLVEELGGGTDTLRENDDDRAVLARLIEMGSAAVPALIEGLTFPSGYSEKRAMICEALGRIGDRDAAPWLAATLRDPVPAVAEWACWALEEAGDAATVPQLVEFERVVPSLFGRDAEGDEACPADRVLTRAARARLLLGDSSARADLVNLLLSPSHAARQIAIDTLAEKFGDRRGYDPDAGPAERAAAAARWRK